jgi:hypothetical protein
MEFDDLQPLRRAGAGDAEKTPEVTPEYPPGSGISPHPIAQLVADLIETTALIPLDRLTSASTRRPKGSRSPVFAPDRAAKRTPRYAS